MSQVTDAMVNRFLSWKLPEDFHPDAGISFSPEFNVEYNAKHGRPPQRHEPIGTNLLTATQARAMLEHVLQGDTPPSSTVPIRACLQWCVDHDGECLGDHQSILASCIEALKNAPSLQEQADDELRVRLDHPKRACPICGHDQPHEHRWPWALSSVETPPSATREKMVSVPLAELEELSLMAAISSADPTIDELDSILDGIGNKVERLIPNGSPDDTAKEG